ncbi:gluconate 2-dehydrogenase subunit 3 family protein [Natronoarchaeum sp. GCM10025321]|uniref:gluconate 2-dehydrogenase subunit 3 family protein n=1 Tax=Natronoarchaeum sp. GCM10025321 TaxID=3252684 RepID=UPI00360FDC25
MKLTRRDAVAALAAVGATGGVALAARRRAENSTDSDGEWDDGLPDEETVRASMTAIATVVYPDEVSGVEAFVDRFLDGRLDRSAHAEGVHTAVADLDEVARSWHGAPITELPPEDRDTLLRETGADTAEEDSEGSLAERVRYYVINELLLALYTSPTGGELVGLENPQGHPGGAESYQEGPQ